MPDVVARPRAGRFGTVQVVAVELAAIVAVVAPYALPLYPAVAIGVVAVLVLLMLAIGHYAGRWWYEVIAAWWLLRTRRGPAARAAATARSAGPYRAELAALAPHLAVRTVTDRNMAIGIGTDDLGWFAAIAVEAPDGLSRGDGAALRLDWLARLAGEPAAPLGAVQVVVRHTPLPGAVIDPRSPCAESYRELRDSLAAPPHREVWIAVRLGLREGALAAADRDGDVAGIHRVLGGTLTRISATLTSLGLAHQVLDGGDLQLALIGAYGPDPHDGGLARVPAAAHETWSRWRAAQAAHVCFAVVGWPAEAPADVLTELARVPGAVSVCTAILLGAIRRPGGEHGPVGARIVVRVVAPHATVTACVRELRASARRLNLRLVRLDGEQAAAVYATTPTAAPHGWGLSW